METMYLARLSVMGVGLILAVLYVKALKSTVTDKDLDSLKDQTHMAMQTVPQSLLVTVMVLIQSMRLLMGVGFVLGALSFMPSQTQYLPMVLLVTDAGLVIDTTIRLMKAMLEGEIRTVKKPNKPMNMFNLITVGVVLGIMLAV